jgi:acetyl esterase/lipase
MASWQMYLADAIMRTTVKPRVARCGHVAGARAISAGRPFPALPFPKGARFQEDVLGGVPGEWVFPSRGRSSATTLLYFHGGGYFTGSPAAHRPISVSLAKSGFNVFLPDYRLAPENPYPAAVDDAEAAWDALSRDGRREIAIGGDSAGGGLALALMHRLREKGKPMPFAAALFSPWTDLSLTGDSLHANAWRDALFSVAAVRTAAGWYLQGADPRRPDASPLYGSLEGFPPLFIEVGEREILRDDSTRLAERARAKGVDVTLNLWPAVCHAWQLACWFLPEARRSLEQTASFLRAARP